MNAEAITQFVADTFEPEEAPHMNLSSPADEARNGKRNGTSVWFYRTIIGVLTTMLLSLGGMQIVFWSKVLTTENVRFPWPDEKPLVMKMITDNTKDIQRIDVVISRMQTDLTDIRVGLAIHDRNPGAVGEYYKQKSKP